MAQQPNFSFSKPINPYAGITLALNGAQRALANNLNMYQKDEALKQQAAQQELANKRADAQLKMQQDEAARRAAEAQRKIDTRKAVNAAIASPDILGDSVTSNINDKYNQLMDKYKGDLSSEEYDADLKKLNNMVASNYQDRVNNPLMTSKQRANALYSNLSQIDNIDPVTAQTLALNSTKFNAPAKADTTAAQKVLDNVYKQRSQLLRSQIKAGKSNSSSKYGTNKLKNEKALYDTIDKNFPKYTLHTSVSGEDSGMSLKDKATELLKAGVPAALVADGISRASSGSDGTLDTRTVDLDRLGAFIDSKAIKLPDDSIVYEGFNNAGGYLNAKELQAAQTKLDSDYSKAYANLTPKGEVDRRIGLTDDQLGFGIHNNLDEIFGKPKASTNAVQITTKPKFMFDTKTSIGKAMSTPTGDNALANLLAKNKTLFTKEYNNLKEPQRNAVDKVLGYKFGIKPATTTKDTVKDTTINPTVAHLKSSSKLTNEELLGKDIKLSNYPDNEKGYAQYYKDLELQKKVREEAKPKSTLYNVWHDLTEPGYFSNRIHNIEKDKGATEALKGMLVSGPGAIAAGTVAAAIGIPTATVALSRRAVSMGFKDAIESAIKKYGSKPKTLEKVIKRVYREGLRKTKSKISKLDEAAKPKGSSSDYKNLEGLI